MGGAFSLWGTRIKSERCPSGLKGAHGWQATSAEKFLFQKDWVPHTQVARTHTNSHVTQKNKSMIRT